MNRCDVCGKFKAWISLRMHFTPDHDGPAGSVAESSWFECSECFRKTEEGAALDAQRALLLEAGRKVR